MLYQCVLFTGADGGKSESLAVGQHALWVSQPVWLSASWCLLAWLRELLELSLAEGLLSGFYFLLYI